MSSESCALIFLISCDVPKFSDDKDSCNVGVYISIIALEGVLLKSLESSLKVLIFIIQSIWLSFFFPRIWSIASNIFGFSVTNLLNMFLSPSSDAILSFSNVEFTHYILYINWNLLNFEVSVRFLVVVNWSWWKWSVKFRITVARFPE